MGKKKVETVVETVTKTAGRPPVYTGALEAAIVKVIKEHGLTHGQVFLQETGIQLKPGGKREKIKVSMPTLGKLAARNGIKLQRGRPAVAA